MILSISEASKQFNVSRTTLYRMRNSGQLSFTKKFNDTTGIDLSELIRIFGENKMEQNRETKRNTANTQSYDPVTENFYLKQENERLMRNLQRTETQVDQLLVSLREQNQQLYLTHAQSSKSFWQRLWQK